MASLDRHLGCVQTDTTLLFSQQLPTFLLFRDRRSAAQPRWIRLHSSSNIVGATNAHYAWFIRLMGGLPTMYCRSQHCWELLHPFAHHCQHARNNVGNCCVRLHAALRLTAEMTILVRKNPPATNKTKIS